MTTLEELTEADILADIVAPGEAGMNPQWAHAILSLRFSDEAKERIRALLEKNNRGTIALEERLQLEKYLRMGQFLDLMQAKARCSIQTPDEAE